MIFAYFRIKEVGGSRKFGDLQTRNAVTHGTSEGCICDCLGAVSGKVSIALTCGRVTTIRWIYFKFFEKTGSGFKSAFSPTANIVPNLDMLLRQNQGKSHSFSQPDAE